MQLQHIRLVIFLLLLQVACTFAAPSTQPTASTGPAGQSQLEAFLESPATRPSTAPANAAPDLIDRLVHRLRGNPLWTNGIYQHCELPVNAKLEDVVVKAMKLNPVDTANRVLELRKVDLGFGREDSFAALVQTDDGTKILLLSPLSRSPQSISWWPKIFDAVPAHTATTPAEEERTLTRLIAELHANRAWSNARFHALDLAEDLSVGEVIDASMRWYQDRSGELRSHRVIVARQIEGLITPGNGSAIIVLFSTDEGRKALLFGLLANKRGWWIRLFDVPSLRSISDSAWLENARCTDGAECVTH